ncbi:hypothetical protein [Polaromonas sp. JS666]|uniref:hypothetical protein n=1 Tax=Polaromonas sp. (strain JS666 / ATCC BAA-500) TaxID=296591 RepID=UPI00059CC542|nr:hypothetical protein [Polaromonas sp. JS666]
MTAPIKLRGTISDKHSVFQACIDMPPRACFQLLMTLAEEAWASRSSLARLLHDGHPLKATLQHLSSHEALVLLIGLTGVRPGWEQPASEIARTFPAPPSTLSDKPPSVTPKPLLGVPRANSEVEFDDGDFEVLGGRPG